MAEPTVNQLVATTLANYHKQFADNVSNSNAVTALLREGNRIRIVDGGRSINCPLTYAEETFAWYMGTELLSRAVKETISEADYEPANAVASVTLSGPDLAKNKGRERILNLLEGKMDNAEATMKNNITKAVYGDGTVAKSFAGLKAMITNDGTGIVGGIDASTWTFWKNQFQTATRQTGVLQYADLKAAMNALWLKLVRGTEHADLVVVDGEIYATYEGKWDAARNPWRCRPHRDATIEAWPLQRRLIWRTSAQGRTPTRILNRQRSWCPSRPSAPTCGRRSRRSGSADGWSSSDSRTSR